MQEFNRSRILGAAVVLSAAVAASFVTSTVVASRAYLQRGEQQVRQSRTLDVTGSARLRISSDLALWTIRVAGEGRTLQEAFQKLDASAAQILEFLAKRGFPADALSLTAISTTPYYRHDEKGRETRELISYQLSRKIEVKSADVRRVAQADGAVTELLQSGVHVESYAPDYIYTKLADIKLEMIGRATANARERAEKIAAESRCRVGAVKDARSGVFQITPPWSTEVSSSGCNDTSSIEKDIASVVHLTLTIEPQ
jgi:hypothetical protein